MDRQVPRPSSYLPAESRCSHQATYSTLFPSLLPLWQTTTKPPHRPRLRDQRGHVRHLLWAVGDTRCTAQSALYGLPNSLSLTTITSIFKPRHEHPASSTFKLGADRKWPVKPTPRPLGQASGFNRQTAGHQPSSSPRAAARTRRRCTRSSCDTSWLPRHSSSSVTSRVPRIEGRCFTGPAWQLSFAPFP